MKEEVCKEEGCEHFRKLAGMPRCQLYGCAVRDVTREECERR